MRLPRPYSGSGATESARVARASASIDRPCSAARTRSRSRISSSSPRIVSVAIPPPLVLLLATLSIVLLGEAGLPTFHDRPIASLGVQLTQHPDRAERHPVHQQIRRWQVQPA